MSIILIGAGVLTATSLLVAALVRVGHLVRRRHPPRFWRRVLWWHAGLIPLYVLVVMPAFMGWFASRRIGTRRDESAYQGPWVDARGAWTPQKPKSLGGGARAALDPALADAARAHAVHFSSGDGTPLRGFLVNGSTPGLCAVLVHGLFRGALEIDPVGAMFHELGLDVLLLELRNHGGSGCAPATYGLAESGDVLAAVQFVRARTGHEHDRIVLFGVSLGTVAVILAAPRVAQLAGLVLDAPIGDLTESAHRFLNAPAKAGGARRRLELPEPFVFLIIHAAELWSGFDAASVRPIEVLRTLPPALPVLLIGGSLDDRVPPAAAQRCFAALPSSDGVKELWIREGSGHGDVWNDDPAGYREHLRHLIERVRKALP